MPPRHNVVLLVEDNPGDQELVRRSLEPEASLIQLEIAEDGIAAMDYLARADAGHDANFPIPQLVLLDINLPGLDGLEVLRALRGLSSLRLTPVVVLSTSENPSDMRRAFELQCNSYVLKPSSFDGYSETLSLVRDYWLRCNRPPYRM